MLNQNRNRSRNRVDRDKRRKSLNRGYQKRRRNRGILIGIILSLIVCGCIGGYFWFIQNEDDVKVVSEGSLDIQLQSEVETASRYTLEDLLAIEQQVDETQEKGQLQTYVENMSLMQKVGSIFMVTADDLADIQIAIQAGNQTKERIQQYPVGGIHYKEHNFENIDQMKLMLNNTTIYSNIPLFFAADATMKTRVENTGNTLDEVGFQIDASVDGWNWVKADVNTPLETMIKMVTYDGTKTASQLLKEGADMIYIEGDFEKIYQELLKDVQDGTVTEEELTQHVEKVMAFRI